MKANHAGYLVRSVVGWIATLGVFIGCNSQTLDIDETDVVVTFEDEERDYSNLETFSVPETVVDLCDVAMAGAGGTERECKQADHSLDDTILYELRERMAVLGYREVEPADDPDAVFFVGIVARDNWRLVSAPGYCYDWYRGSYYDCFNPGYTYAYNLPTSSILIEMAVRDDDSGELSSAWTAVLKGLHRRSERKSGAQRVKDAMARAFRQSPYLGEGGAR